MTTDPLPTTIIVQFNSQVFFRHGENKTAVVQNTQKPITYKQYETRRKTMWINEFTGELYMNLWHAMTTMLADLIRCPQCRTWKFFNISRYR